MIRSHDALLRHGQEFFLQYLVGLYVWDQVFVEAPQAVDPISPQLGGRERRAEMEKRQGRGRYLEQVRLVFPLPRTAAKWEILIYSSMERPPIGEVVLRDYDRGTEVVKGPLDPATWAKIGNWIKSNDQHQRKIAS